MAKAGRPSLRSGSVLLLVMGMVACTSEQSDVRTAAQPFASAHQSALDTSTYNFESGTQGWTYTSGEVTGVSTSTAQAYTGSGDHSLAVSIGATGAASEGPYVNNPTTPAGVTVTFHVWIPSGSTVTAIKPWAMEANSSNWDGNWIGTFNTNAWNTVTLDIPANAATPLDSLGVEFEVSGAWSGTLYLDAIDWPGGSCTPTTCSAQGANCGTISDGCGGNLNCGSCPSGQSCSANVCSLGCTPTTCAAAGAQCGTISDGCGGTLNCGSCASGQSCSANVCTGGGSAAYTFDTSTQGWTYSAGSVATSSAQTYEGAQSLAVSIAASGSQSNGPSVASPSTPAGATVTFHVWIPSGSTITAIKPWAMEANSSSWDGSYIGTFNTNAWNTVTLDIPANAATPLDSLGVEFETSGAWTGTVYLDSVTWPGGGGSCNPTTCSAAGAQCGSLSDGCGGTLSCGTCPAGQFCNANVCTNTCTPTTCSAAGAQCGSISDNCGGTLNCGSCASGQSCTNNLCSGGGGGSSIQYNFDASTQGWTYSAGSVATSSAQTYEGAQSLAVSIAASGSQSNGPSVASPSTPAGATVTFHVWIPSGSTITAIKPWAMEANSSSWDGSYIGTFNANAWNTVTLDIPANAATPLDSLGVEFETSGAWSGTVYVDSVSWPGGGGSCNPTTCSAAGAQCGSIGDGCGGTLSCGNCPTGQYCSNNVCGGTVPSGTIRVMPLGDSITLGDTYGGYRYKLYNDLIAAGYDINMVGSRNNGSVADADHSGFDGYSIADLAGIVDGELTAHPADYILLMIGTNNVAWWSAQTGAEIAAMTENLITQIQNDAPNAWLIVSTIPPETSQTIQPNGFDRQQLTIDYNNALTAYVQARVTLGQKVRLADAYGALMPFNPTVDLYDGIHPSRTGYDKVADAWKTALVPVLDGGTGGCTPLSCATAGAQCGSISDGCGGTLSCGSCPSGQSCSANLCSGGGGGSSIQYNFDTSVQGWTSPGGMITGVSTSSTQTYQGAQSLAVSIAATAAGSHGPSVSSPTTPAGATVTFHVWIPSGSTIIAVKPWAMEAGGVSWDGAYFNTFTANAWNTVSLNLPSSAATPLDSLGVEFEVSGAWSGTVYVDSVSWPDGGGTCNPTTCAAAGAQCGTISDGCGGALSCGNCPSGQSCSANVCTTNCTPTTCAALGAQCGSIGNGCGGTLNCGGCPSGQSCSANVCSCNPTTCSAQGAQCGSISNGCGGTLNCGGCPSGQSCSANVCSCNPTTCAAQGAQCGSISDGCGGTLNCGGCSNGQSCSANVCTGGGGVTSGRFRSVSTRGATVTITGYTNTLETIAAYQQTADPSLSNVRGSTYPNTGAGQMDACEVTWYPWSMTITLATGDDYWFSNGARSEQTQVLVRKISSGDVVYMDTGDAGNGPSDSTTCRTSWQGDNSAQLPIIYFNGTLPADLNCSGGDKSPMGCPFDCNLTVGCDSSYATTTNNFWTPSYRYNVDGQSTALTRFDAYGATASRPVPSGAWQYQYEAGICIGGTASGSPCELFGPSCAGGGTCDSYWTVMRRYQSSEDSLNIRRGENRRDVYVDTWVKNKYNDVNNREIGVVARWYNADNYFVFMVREYGGDYARLQQRSNGVYGTLATASPSLDLTNWTRLGLKVIDQGSWTDTQFVPNGNCWLGGYINSALQVYSPWAACSQNPYGKYGVFSYYNANSQFYNLTAYSCNPDFTCY